MSAGTRTTPQTLATCNHGPSTTCPECTQHYVRQAWPSFDANDIRECGLPLLWTVWERLHRA